MYKRFFGICNDLDVWARATIVSTNYDLVFEYLAWVCGLECAYPFSVNEMKFEAIEAGNGPNRYVQCGRSGNSAVALCKLHGSVNFFEDAFDESDKTLYVANDVAGKGWIGRSRIDENSPAVFALDAIWNIRERYGSSLTPAIVPPTYAKSAERPWLQVIWKYAFNAISLAKTLVFIGYSMPATDGFLRAAIQAALVSHQKVNDLKVYVVDPNPKVQENFKQLLGLIQCESVPYRFGEAIDI